MASVIEFSVCLSVCLSVLCKFSNFFLQYKAAAVRKNFVRMNTDVSAGRWAVDGGGGGGIPRFFHGFVEVYKCPLEWGQDNFIKF